MKNAVHLYLLLLPILHLIGQEEEESSASSSKPCTTSAVTAFKDLPIIHLGESKGIGIAPLLTHFPLYCNLYIVTARTWLFQMCM